jgi:serine protease Do
MKRSLGWVVALVALMALAASVLWPALHPEVASVPLVSAATPGSTTKAVQAPAELGSVRAVAERAKPAVVQITNQQVALDRLGRPSPTGTGIGSGVIYDPQGLILTNNHVIDGAASLLVTLPDGRILPGKLLGGDPQTDLAVLKIDPQPGESLPVAVLGDSDALNVGDWLVAIGNALGLPGGPTVTAGVASALGRSVQESSSTPGEVGPYLYDLIQTDAAINPGNSGGPLLNMAGEVVGINTLVAGGDGYVATQGIGFSIAVNAAKPIAEQLVSQGRVAHPFLGIFYHQLTPAIAEQLSLSAKQGVVVTQLVSGAPAEKAGLQVRDVISTVDGQQIVDETTLGRALNRHKPGERAQLSVVRGDQRLTLDVTLSEKPS